MVRPGGLGKGLGALIPTGEIGRVSESSLQDIPIGSVRPNPNQPREHFDEEAIGTLADSIREVGVLQPILVRPGSDDTFELVAGERRWRAARRAGLQTIPAIVRDVDHVASLQQAIVENVQREGLNPIEEAAAYQQLIEDFQLTHEDVAVRVGKSRASISNTLRLLQLAPVIQRYVKEGALRMGHARALLGTPDRAFQEQLARRAVAEDLSVRAVEEAVRARVQPTERATPIPAPMRPAGLLELEEMLSDYLDTRVKVAMSDRRGKVTVEFATLEDLERIYRRMTRDDA